MARKRMIVADGEGLYLQELFTAFTEQDAPMEVGTFTKKKLLCQYLRQGGPADILVVDESFADEEVARLAPSSAKIALSVSMKPIDGFAIVQKDQRKEGLLQDILKNYAKGCGRELP